MLDSSGVQTYWKEQLEKGDNPCHYHNKWQDSYAFRVRSRAFRKTDFDGARHIVDLGCGVGEYTKHIGTLTSADIWGFDFPFLTEKAAETFRETPRFHFEGASLPNPRVMDRIAAADVVYTTTVYVHLAPDARAAFFAAIERMRPGARVLLLEYAPDVVPAFQQGLPHKEVETARQIQEKFERAGWKLEEIRPVNYIDSFLFFHLGKHALTYAITLGLDTLLAWLRLPRSKYKLLRFVKR